MPVEKAAELSAYGREDEGEEKHAHHEEGDLRHDRDEHADDSYDEEEDRPRQVVSLAPRPAPRRLPLPGAHPGRKSTLDFGPWTLDRAGQGRRRRSGL